MCNKLASRHVRVGLAEPSVVPCCDICENAPGMSSTFAFLFRFNFLCIVFFIKVSNFSSSLYVAFFYCEIDGSSLCLQCDMIVHVGGKRTHGRYLVLRQRVEVCDCIIVHIFFVVLCITVIMPPVIWIILGRAV